MYTSSLFLFSFLRLDTDTHVAHGPHIFFLVLVLKLNLLWCQQVILGLLLRFVVGHRIFYYLYVTIVIYIYWNHIKILYARSCLLSCRKSLLGLQACLDSLVDGILLLLSQLLLNLIILLLLLHGLYFYGSRLDICRFSPWNTCSSMMDLSVSFPTLAYAASDYANYDCYQYRNSTSKSNHLVLFVTHKLV